jgi:phosphohistidine phosphatase SixA
VQRRCVLAAFLACPVAAPAQEPDSDEPSAVHLLRQGGVVVAIRHALAPGTFDPPEFKLDDCRTQRNLSDEGRAQAKRIGQWFERHGLKPDRVRSSPWCRCVDTAHLAFSKAEVWAALGSPVSGSEQVNVQSQLELAQAVDKVSTQPRRIEAWVTHQFVLSALVGVSLASGEGVLLQTAGKGERPLVLGRILVS